METIISSKTKVSCTILSISCCFLNSVNIFKCIFARSVKQNLPPPSVKCWAPWGKENKRALRGIKRLLATLLLQSSSSKRRFLKLEGLCLSSWMNMLSECEIKEPFLPPATRSQRDSASPQEELSQGMGPLLCSTNRHRRKSVGMNIRYIFKC